MSSKRSEAPLKSYQPSLLNENSKKRGGTLGDEKKKRSSFDSESDEDGDDRSRSKADTLHSLVRNPDDSISSGNSWDEEEEAEGAGKDSGKKVVEQKLKNAPKKPTVIQTAPVVVPQPPPSKPMNAFLGTMEGAGRPVTDTAVKSKDAPIDHASMTSEPLNVFVKEVGPYQPSNVIALGGIPQINPSWLVAQRGNSLMPGMTLSETQQKPPSTTFSNLPTSDGQPVEATTPAYDPQGLNINNSNNIDDGSTSKLPFPTVAAESTKPILSAPAKPLRSSNKGPRDPPSLFGVPDELEQRDMQMHASSTPFDDPHPQKPLGSGNYIPRIRDVDGIESSKDAFAEGDAALLPNEDTGPSRSRGKKRSTTAISLPSYAALEQPKMLLHFEPTDEAHFYMREVPPPRDHCFSQIESCSAAIESCAQNFCDNVYRVCRLFVHLLFIFLAGALNLVFLCFRTFVLDLCEVVSSQFFKPSLHTCFNTCVQPSFVFAKNILDAVKACLEPMCGMCSRCGHIVASVLRSCRLVSISYNNSGVNREDAKIEHII